MHQSDKCARGDAACVCTRLVSVTHVFGKRNQGDDDDDGNEERKHVFLSLDYHEIYYMIALFFVSWRKLSNIKNINHC